MTECDDVTMNVHLVDAWQKRMPVASYPMIMSKLVNGRRGDRCK